MQTEKSIKAFRFNAENQDIRTIVIENEPWFVAKDICNILGHTNSRVAVQMLDDDERGKKSLPRQGETWIINESGLYNLIFRSNKPQAKVFRKWVTDTVLPTIRRTGGYQKENYHMLASMFYGSVKTLKINQTTYYKAKDVIKLLGKDTHHANRFAARYEGSILVGQPDRRDSGWYIKFEAIEDILIKSGTKESINLHIALFRPELHEAKGGLNV
jgi:prophage antirepressor-like protein